ncbi:hypothetical protein BJ878DRAFT_494394 [Calycina marina]|uniref:Uncharacterized protein n=1 Tax=Calycina marina TaxID=1763456 RepID=A0A9P7Z895_9HELO|nr:hypothetical protein BJ878DRAFT_494394 [Calycina marina]
MAKMVCDCEYLDRLADAPKAELRMKINNKKINTQRDIDNATGRLAKKAGYDASSLLRLAERRESSGPSTPDKTSAPAPAPPTGSKKRKPSSTRVFDKDEDGDSDFSRGRKSSTSKKLRPTAKKNSGLGRPPKASKTRAQSMSELPPRMMSASIRAASRPGSSVVCPPVPQFPPHMAPGSGPVHPPCNSPAHQSFGGYFSPGSPHTTYMSPNCALGSGSPGMFLAASQFNNHFPLPDFGQQPPQSQNSQRLPGGVSSHDAA